MPVERLAAGKPPQAAEVAERAPTAKPPLQEAAGAAFGAVQSYA
jgi:hypothetical protein